MIKRLLRMSVLGMLTFALLLGGGSARAVVAHTDPSAYASALPESCSIQDNGNFALCPAIAFTSTRDNPMLTMNTGEIYLMLTKQDGTPDPTQTRRLTNNDGAQTSGEGFATLSPDGKKMVFDSNRDAVAHNESRFISDLYVMNLEDSDNLQHPVPDAKQVHLTRGSSATWSSPDGKKIAFHASRSGIYSAATLAREDPGSPTLDSDIFVMNVDDCRKVKEQYGVDDCRQIPGEHVKNLTLATSPTFIDEDPDWSPDGQKIVFTSHDGEKPDHNNTHGEIYMMNADGTGREQLTTTNTGEERSPTWSPNGTRILFMCRRGGVIQMQLCVLNKVNGAWVETQLTTSGQHLTPSWSPDGTQIVFHKPVAGQGQQLALIKLNQDGTCGTCPEEQLTSRPGVNVFANRGVLRITGGAPTVTQPSVRAPAAPPVPQPRGR